MSYQDRRYPFPEFYSSVFGRALALLAAILLLLFLTACSEEPAAVDEGGEGPTIAGPWIRPAGSGMNTAAYMNLQAGSTDDTLLGASFEGATDVMIHETVVDGDLVRMEHLTSLPLAAGESAAFEPGGKHVMITGLTAPLASGEAVTLVLNFEKAGSIPVEFRVRRDFE